MEANKPEREYRLEPMIAFLDNEVEIGFLAERLNLIFYEYIQFVMYYSEKEGVPVSGDESENAYWLKSIKGVLEAMIQKDA
ncbi:MAG: hypothetical protein LBH58_03340 [Tannerellaceae bacterium]|jgi:hypothetical protein|nr:hypothetical protein [Tannerellaceae bacterium]